MRCTVFKRAIDRTYNLKLKQSRQFFNDVLNRYPSFPFSLNSFEDDTTAKLGIKECQQHELVIPYPVLAEKPGSLVAQFKITVMITKGKTTALTGLPIEEGLFKTDLEIKDEKILELLKVHLISNAAIYGQGRAEEREEESCSRGEEVMIHISSI